MMTPGRELCGIKAFFLLCNASCSVRDVLAVIDFISISRTTAAHLLAIAPPINARAIEVSWFASGYERSPSYRKIRKLLLRSS